MSGYPFNIRILSGAYADTYLATRNDDPLLCTSAGKRKILYRAIAEACGTTPILLSLQPRGRGAPSALAEISSEFAGYPQLFSPACGIRKLRYFVDMFRYAQHVFRHTDQKSILILDNYEINYVLAAYYCRLRGRRNPVILEYEDGKHVIDRGYVKAVTWMAELLGRPLVKAAILATPTLARRLPAYTPTVLVPGILEKEIQLNPLPPVCCPTHFLYSGSLDVERGIPLLLDYLESITLPSMAVFEITGQGQFRERFVRLMQRYPKQVIYHGSVSNQVLAEIRSHCHFGLNLQSSNNPISDVTYPSKTFDYLNAGLRVISTRAAGVDTILGDAAHYLDDESAGALGHAIENALNMKHDNKITDLYKIQTNYSLEGTIRRIKKTLENIFNSSPHF